MGRSDDRNPKEDSKTLDRSSLFPFGLLALRSTWRTLRPGERGFAVKACLGPKTHGTPAETEWKSFSLDQLRPRLAACRPRGMRFVVAAFIGVAVHRLGLVLLVCASFPN